MTRVELEGVAGKHLARLDLLLDTGVSCFVIEPDNGVAEIAAIVAGASRPRRGTVRVDGKDPFKTPALRRRTALLLPVEDPLEGETVAGAVARLLAFRGTQAPDEVLGAAGIGAWSGRRPATLSAEECRTVALALALAMPDPAVVSLVEPFAAGVDRRIVASAMARFSAGGATVICATASEKDAVDLGGRVLTVRRSRRRSQIVDAAHPAGASTELVVRSRRAVALASVLALDADISAVVCDSPRTPYELVVRGPDLERVSLAVMRAAAGNGITLDAIEPGGGAPAGPALGRAPLGAAP